MEQKQLNLIYALAITVVIFFLELIGGFFSNSLALISDSGHVLTDALALVMVLLVTFFALRPADRERTFGSFRLEILSALFNGSILIMVSLFIFYEAFSRFYHPEPVQTGVMMVVALIGLAANFGAAFLLSGGSKENLNLKGAYLHVLSDTGASVGVIVGGGIIAVTHWYVIDPIIGLFIGVLIMKGAIDLVMESVNILLESAPVGVSAEAVAGTIRGVKGVRDLHDLHVWTISSGINSLSAHVKIDPRETERPSEIIAEINRVLKEKYQIIHSTIQTECEDCPEGLYCRMERKEKDHHGHHH